MRRWWDDLRAAIKAHSKSPGLFLTAALTLAVGIGTSTAIFSIVNGVLLKPLPFAHPERVVSFYSYYSQMSMRGAFSPPTLVDFREHLRSFQSIAATAPWNANLTGSGEATRIEGLLVSSNFFETIGTKPQHGRGFLRMEEMPGNENVVVISNRLWKTQFGGRELLGKTITLNDVAYDVVGIMPPEFRWGRRYGREKEADIWAPYALTEERIRDGQRGSEYLDLIGRLQEGVTLEHSRSEVIRLCEKLHQQYPRHYQLNNGWILQLRTLQEEMVTEVRPFILVLFAAVGLLLLIAGSNVANLLLARGTQRQREIAIRFALGASRLELVRLLLIESIILALAGGVLGFLLAIWSLEGMVVFRAAGIPRLDEVVLDLRLLSFSFGVSVMTGLLFGVIPAFRITKAAFCESLKEGSRSGTSGIHHRRIRDILVVTQISVSLILLVGAFLLLNSFQKILAVHPGFRADSLLTLKLSLSSQRYADFDQRILYFNEILEQVRSLPDIVNAAAINILPMGKDVNTSSFEIEGRPQEAGQDPAGEMWIVTPEYFQTMSIPVISGRAFSSQDSETSVPVVLIDEVMAQRFWPGEDPIGKRIDFEGSGEDRRWRRIIGVVGQVKQRNLEDIARPQYYVPYAQLPMHRMALVVRTGQDPSRVVASVRNAVYKVDPDEPVYEMSSMEQLISDSLAQRRLTMLLLSGFAAAALFLAGIGLYGVLTVSVSGRRQEFSIRMILGANRKKVLLMVLRHTMKLTGAGIAIGSVAALLAARHASSLLFQTPPSDLWTFALVAALMFVVALTASYLPVRHAVAVHPSEALKYE